MEEMKMYLANRDVKFTIKRLGFTQSQVANEMGISYSYFTKLLQLPLSPRFRRRADTALKSLVKKRYEQQKKVLEWAEDPKSGLLGDDYYKKEGRNIE